MFTKNAYKAYVHQKCIQGVCSPKMHGKCMSTKGAAAWRAYVHQVHQGRCMFTKNAYKAYVHQKCIQSVCSPKMHTRRMFIKNAYKAYVHQKCMESVCSPREQLLDLARQALKTWQPVVQKGKGMLCRKLQRDSWLCRKAHNAVQKVETWQLVVQKGTKCLRVSTFGSVSYLA